jgi:hypothetical protein
LGRSVHSIKKNTEALVVVSKEIGLEVHADKFRYTLMSSDQNTWRRYSIKIDNNSFESVEEFKYLGATSGNHNSIQRADWSLGTLAIIRCGIFCLTVCYPKM